MRLVCFVLFSLLVAEAAYRMPRAMHFDVEPQVNDEWKTDEGKALVLSSYIDFYIATKDRLSGSGLALAADVPFWMSDYDTTKNGVTKKIPEFLRDLLDRYSIMAYRDWIHGARNLNTATEINGRTQSGFYVSQPTLDLLAAGTRSIPVTYSMETMCGLTPSWISFCGQSTTYLEDQIQLSTPELSAYPFFFSFGMHFRNTWEALSPSYTVTGARNREIYEWQGHQLINSADRTQFWQFVNSHKVKGIFLDSTELLNFPTQYLDKFMVFLQEAEQYDVDIEFLVGDPLWALESGRAGANSYIDQAKVLMNLIRNYGSASPATSATTAATPVEQTSASATSNAALTTVVSTNTGPINGATTNGLDTTAASSSGQGVSQTSSQGAQTSSQGASQTSSQGAQISSPIGGGVSSSGLPSSASAQTVQASGASEAVRTNTRTLTFADDEEVGSAFIYVPSVLLVGLILFS